MNEVISVICFRIIGRRSRWGYGWEWWVMSWCLLKPGGVGRGYMGYMEFVMRFYLEMYFLNSITLFLNWEVLPRKPCIFTCSCVLELNGCISLEESLLKWESSPGTFFLHVYNCRSSQPPLFLFPSWQKDWWQGYLVATFVNMWDNSWFAEYTTFWEARYELAFSRNTQLMQDFRWQEQSFPRIEPVTLLAVCPLSDGDGGEVAPIAELGSPPQVVTLHPAWAEFPPQDPRALLTSALSVLVKQVVAC